MKKGANLFGPDATGTGQSQDSAHLPTWNSLVHFRALRLPDPT